MRLVIDASNIRGGGGVIYLRELLRNVRPEEYGFNEVFVYSGLRTLQLLETRPCIKKIHDALLDASLPLRLYWRHFKLGKLLSRAGCDVLFLPGGSYGGSFRPYVTASLNMLPFEWREARRYGVSWHLIKFIFLHFTQLSAFSRSDGIIFPSAYAQSTVRKFMKGSNSLSVVIPMGVDERFYCQPKQQKPISHYTNETPFRLLYVSPIAPYKHQWNVMKAMAKLRKSGLPIMIEFIGGIRNCKKRFLESLSLYDAGRQWIKYRGEIAFKDLHNLYAQADTFIFASSCEAGGSFIQFEAMSGGLPIACSNRGPMPEVLGDAGVYFDPENPEEIANAVESLVLNPQLREDKAWAAFQRSKEFTWERCAHQTMEFLSIVAKRKNK